MRVGLGWSKLSVSKACLGTMNWGERVCEEEAHKILDCAIKKYGINFVDTSEIYPVPNSVQNHGSSEIILGNWLEKHKNLREDLVIATKVMGYTKSTFAVYGREEDFEFQAKNKTTPGGRKSSRHSREQILQACSASLKRLKVDYIDLYYLHWPDRYVPMYGRQLYREDHHRADTISIKEIVSAIGELIQDGKIKHWGLSNETCFGICQFCNEAQKQGIALPIAIQNSFSLLDRSYEMSSLYEACSTVNYNISLVGYSPFCGGSLTGKYIENIPKGSRFDTVSKFEERYNNEFIREAVLEYKKLADKYGYSLSELALAFCQSRPCLSSNGSVIIGAASLEQLESNLKCFPKLLDQTILDEIDEVYLKHKDPVKTI